MPYVKNGQVVDSQEWSIAYLMSCLTGLYDEVLFFFQTLISPSAAQHGTQTAARIRQDTRQAPGGGGTGGRRPPGHNGGAPRVTGMDTLNRRTVSSVACGGGG
ncbi:hypothetical protein WJX74_001506 [Apatococcus lobatus]|uniref:Uncharacterized protein n=2 Tax=Apatococcus TaxID=904362 RepID=A0AAW1SUA4_9CHLO